eukprot:Stramenopile-MAST_4_protein_262
MAKTEGQEGTSTIHEAKEGEKEGVETATIEIVSKSKNPEGNLDDNDDMEYDELEDDKPFCKRFKWWCISDKEDTHWFFLSVYILFVFNTFFFAIMQKQPSPDAFYMTEAVVSRLIETKFPDRNGPNYPIAFREINDEVEVWNYLRGPFSNMFKPCTNKTKINCHASIHHNTFLLDNIILTQVRVKPTDMGFGRCVLPKFAGADLKSALHECHLPYTGESSVELKASFNRTSVPASIAPCFQMNPKKFVRSFGGFHTLSYGYRGYTCLGNTVGPSFANQLALLSTHAFVDSATRALYLDFTVYNPDLGLVMFINIGFEFLAAGSIFPYYSTNIVLSDENIATNPFWRYFSFGTFYAFVFSYLIKFSLSFSRARNKRKHCHVCRWMDAANFSMLLWVAFLFWTKNQHEKDARETIDPFQKRNALENISVKDDYVDWMLSMNVLITVGKSFQYLTLSKELSVIIRTVWRAARPLGMSMLTVLAVILGYAVAFHVAFGSKIYAFRSFGHSFMTCVTTLFIKIQLHTELFYSNRVLGPVLLVSYMIFVTFIIMSLCLAIIQTAFHEVRKEVTKEDSAFKSFKTRFSKNLGFTNLNLTKKLSFGSRGSKETLTPADLRWKRIVHALVVDSKRRKNDAMVEKAAQQFKSGRLRGLQRKENTGSISEGDVLTNENLLSRRTALNHPASSPSSSPILPPGMKKSRRRQPGRRPPTSKSVKKMSITIGSPEVVPMEAHTTPDV